MNWRSSSTSLPPYSRGSNATRRRATAAARRRCRKRSAPSSPISATRVPAGVDLLYHLCYGDSNHRHVVEPTDMGDMVEFANRLARNIKRPIDLIHMPVPRNRADDAYFAPLETADAAARNRALPGPRPLHRRRRWHEATPGDGEEIRRQILHRHGMRFRPARPAHDCGAAAHPRRSRRSGLSGLRNKAITHLAEAFDLGLHDIAGVEKRVGALADAAAGAATENVAALQ